MELGKRKNIHKNELARPAPTAKRLRLSPSRQVSAKSSCEAVKPIKLASTAATTCSICRRSALYVKMLETCPLCDTSVCNVCSRTCGGESEETDGLGCGRRVCSTCCKGKTTYELGLDLCTTCQGINLLHAMMSDEQSA